jgi:hypothetical protein
MEEISTHAAAGVVRVTLTKCVRHPSGGRGNIYPVEQIQRIIEARQASAVIPEGFVDRDEACRILGIAKTTWKRWQRAGQIPTGQWARIPGTKPWRRIYSRDMLLTLVNDFSKVGQPYPDPDWAGCYRVPLMSFGSTKCEAIIDAEDVTKVQGKRWNFIEYGEDRGGTVQLARSGNKATRMRYVLLGLDPSCWRVVHANGDPLDCRRANLIAKTLSEKTAGARKKRMHAGQPCTSRFKGVSWDRSRECWVAMIQKEGKQRYLGRFGDEIAAAEARDDAARELFGEHARLNFPDGIDAWLEKEAQRIGEADRREAA